MTVLQQKLDDTLLIKRTAIFFLWVTVAVSAAALAQNIVEHSLLDSIHRSDFGTNGDLKAAADANDRNSKIIAVFHILTYLASTVVWFTWVYRSNVLAHALGASKMTYSPGWSVGWFFIPIVNLFKPYLAMK